MIGLAKTAGAALALGLGLGLGPPASPAGASEPSPPDTTVLAEARRALDEAPDPDARREATEHLVELGDGWRSAGRDSLATQAWETAGWALFRARRNREALDVWTRALQAARAHGDSAHIAAALNSRAIGHAVSGEYEASLALWEECLRIHRASGNRKSEAVNWGNVGNVYNLLGRIPEARAATERGLDLSLETDNRRGVFGGHHRLASILRDAGEPEAAVEHADSAVAIARREGWPEVGSALGRRATALFDLGRTDEALASMAEADSAAAALGDEWSRLGIRGNRATMLLRRGRPEEALGLARSLTEPYATLSAEKRVARATIEGLALEALDRRDEARVVLREAVAVLDSTRAEEEDGGAGLFLRAGQVYGALAQVELASDRPAEAWAISERGRSAALRHRLAAEDPEDEGRTEPASLEEVRAAVAEAGRAALVQFNDAGWLPLVAYVITADGLEVARTGDLEAILEDADRATALLAAGRSDDECAAVLRRLSEALLGEVLPLLPPDTERLLLVPPTSLGGFPFEALPLPGRPGDGPGAGPDTGSGDGPGEDLGSRYALSRIPGSTSLVRLGGRPGGTAGTMVVFADPALPAPEADPLVPSPDRDARLTPLPEARAEARDIAIPGATVLLGDGATVAAFRALDYAPPAVLHFATHAVVDPWDRDRSGLVLAGERGLLTSREVVGHRLGADLVTLSGCRTGGGAAILGEGTDGLPRAFLLAGCRSIVTSLWDVEDGAARRFMALFYGELRRGAPRDEALRRARARLAAEGFPHRDRSAFVLTGLGHEPVATLAAAGGRRFALPTGRAAIGLAALLVLAIAGAAAAFLRLSRRATS